MHLFLFFHPLDSMFFCKDPKMVILRVRYLNPVKALISVNQLENKSLDFLAYSTKKWHLGYVNKDHILSIDLLDDTSE